MKHLTFATLLTCGSVAAAGAQNMNDQIIANLQEQGFGYIEIKNGRTQTKVEAIRGTDKLEVVYDNASGTILKQERERAESDELGLAGVDIDQRNRDFVGSDDDDDDSRDDRDDDRDDDDREESSDDDSGKDGRSDRDDDRSDDDDDDDSDDDDDDSDDDDDDDDD
ncbi:PepSY domain-containing protein [Litoreibacter sp.]|nr:PepSY domain-containing protein [Litoreibacter sp.]